MYIAYNSRFVLTKWILLFNEQLLLWSFSVKKKTTTKFCYTICIRCSYWYTLCSLKLKGFIDKFCEHGEHGEFKFDSDLSDLYQVIYY